MPLAEHDNNIVGDYITSFLVSIHVPLAEHDTSAACKKRVKEFQFTCPSRSTTGLCGSDRQVAQVSIHVPLAEHDGRSPMT